MGDGVPNDVESSCPVTFSTKSYSESASIRRGGIRDNKTFSGSFFSTPGAMRDVCRNALECGMRRWIDFRRQLSRTNSVASQSSNSGCDGGNPVLPKFAGVATMPRVRPGVPTVLTAGLKPYRIAAKGEPGGPAGDSSGRRLALAEWITQADHPLAVKLTFFRSPRTPSGKASRRSSTAWSGSPIRVVGRLKHHR